MISTYACSHWADRRFFRSKFYTVHHITFGLQEMIYGSISSYADKQFNFLILVYDVGIKKWNNRKRAGTVLFAANGAFLFVKKRKYKESYRKNVMYEKQ
jgi:hypothetical protein